MIVSKKPQRKVFDFLRGKQSGFALPIAILIMVVLIIAGGVGYYFYKTMVDETADWKIYRNEKYGFILKFPESWADFEVKEYKWDQSTDPGLLPPYYDVIDFLRTKTPEYDFSIQIQAYSHDQWAVRRLKQQIESSAALPDYPYLGENTDYVFSWRPMEYISHPGMSEEEYTRAKDIIQLRRQETESIISTFKIINPIEKTAEWKDYFNPGECKDIGENDYTNECYLESLKAIKEVEMCKKVRPDYQDFCYFQGAQNLKDSSICENLSTLINQESCYYNIAQTLKKTSICQKIQSEKERDDCYAEIAKSLGDTSICEEIKNIKLKGYCYRWINPPRPELPIPPISEWKTYTNEKHKYSFKHPPKWNFKVDLTNPETSELFVIRERISNEPEWPSEYEWLWIVSINVWDNPSELSLIDWLSSWMRTMPADAPRVANTFVGEEKIEALRLWQGGVDTTWDKPGRCFNDCPNLNIYLVYKDKSYQVALVYNRRDVDQEESQEIFNQILSTFRFIEISEDEIAGYNKPQVITLSPPGLIETNSVTLRGKILDSGGADIDDVSWEFECGKAPGIYTEKLEYSSGHRTGKIPQEYNRGIIDLNVATTYYCRAKSCNLTGCGYGEEISFQTGPYYQERGVKVDTTKKIVIMMSGKDINISKDTEMYCFDDLRECSLDEICREEICGSYQHSLTVQYYVGDGNYYAHKLIFTPQ